MTRRSRYLTIALAGALLVAGRAGAQEEPSAARTSVALRGGYGFSAGDWNKVPYEPEIDLFSGRLALGMDVEVRIGDRWTLAVAGGFEQLDGGDWEAFARSRGDTLSVDASFFYVSLLARAHLIGAGPNMLRLEAGPAMIFPSGKERFNGMLYQYDFFNSGKLGGEIGLEFDRSVSPWVALSIRGDLLFAPSGVSYADGETRVLIAFPVTAGVRLYL